MTEIFNKKTLTARRRYLRNNLPKAEIILWGYIKNRQIEGIKFRRQVSIDSYIVDFYSPEIHLAIEVDGATHITGKEINYDRTRQNKINKLGITFLRFTNEEIYGDLENVIKEITEKIISLKMECKI